MDLISIIGIGSLIILLSLVFGVPLLMLLFGLFEGTYTLINRNHITGDEKFGVSLAGNVRKTNEYRILIDYNKTKEGDPFEVLDAAIAIRSVLDKRGIKTEEDRVLYQIAVETIREVKKPVIEKIEEALKWPSSQKLLNSYGFYLDRTGKWKKRGKLVYIDESYYDEDYEDDYKDDYDGDDYIVL
jgi:hypothetical protein